MRNQASETGRRRAAVLRRAPARTAGVVAFGVDRQRLPAHTSRVGRGDDVELEIDAARQRVGAGGVVVAAVGDKRALDRDHRLGAFAATGRRLGEVPAGGRDDDRRSGVAEVSAKSRPGEGFTLRSMTQPAVPVPGSARAALGMQRIAGVLDVVDRPLCCHRPVSSSRAPDRRPPSG